MSADSNRSIERKIALARFALGFERLWAAALWPTLLLGVFLTLIFSGLLPRLPDVLRYGTIAALGLAYLWSWRPALRLEAPGRAEAMRRIEQASGLDHRPVSALDDELAKESASGPSVALWEEHRIRQLRRLDRVAVVTPRSAWRDFDPRALRVPVALGLVASILLGSGDPLANLAGSLRLAPMAAPNVVSVDAWLKPPAYTGKPPMMLTSPAMMEKLKTDPEILVPENALLSLRVNGAPDARLAFYALSDGADETPVTGLGPRESHKGETYLSETKVSRPVMAKLMNGGSELARWRIAVIPDAPPEVTIAGEPAGDASGTLSVKWKVADDYGVSAVSADISLSDNQDDGLGFASNGVFLFDPPKFPMALRHANPKKEEGSSAVDLASHPWAGLMVEIVLEAKDAAGHVTTTPPRTFRLPERIFVKPLARALIEQRRRLIMDPEESPAVAGLLAAMLTYPQGLIDGSGTHIAIATVISRLQNAESTDDVGEAVAALWRIAVNVEDGALADARAELESLRQQLEKALAEGAPPERIRQLMDKMRGAMDRYLQSMMEETQKRLQQGGPQQQQMTQQGKPVSPEDLQKMLDMIEKLSQSGANDAARQMLSQLDRILRNIQPGQSSPQQGQQGDSPLAKMLDQLSEMMRKQQGLMDDTQRMPQQGDGSLDGETGQQPGDGRLSPDALGDRQQGLGQMLSDLLGQMGKQGLEGSPSLGEAGRQMRGAEESLRQGDREQALGQQGEAMAKLREGARGMVKQLMQQSQGQQGSNGRRGEARGDDHDPLGRPLPNSSEDYGPARNMLPSELALRRAQEILDILRSRANLPELPRLERDYIDRLLRGLY
jgi:uncharacterized protein (TIGR02302 family)